MIRRGQEILFVWALCGHQTRWSGTDLPDLGAASESESSRAVALRTGTDDMALTDDGDDFIALNRVSECPEGSTRVHSGGLARKKTPIKQGVLMRELGLEPRTYALKGRCSTN